MARRKAHAPPANTKQLTPPLKWAGGKRWLLSYLEPVWARHPGMRLAEPFCGGLAVALGLRPKRALLNDINPHAINLYTWMQRGLRIAISMRNDKKCYYDARDEFNRLIASGKWRSGKAAGIFYYLNRTGYNGLCRFNRSGVFNVPFGSYKTITYIRDFTAYKPLLSQWKFTNTDFESMAVKAGDFVYADPPYDVEFRQYAQGGFTWDDQVRLAKWLAKHKGPVVASNQATERILELYRGQGFDMRLLDGPRRISCTGDRAPAKEMLATRGI